MSKYDDYSEAESYHQEWYEEYEYEEPYYSGDACNNFSGTAHNVVQAGSIHGGVHFPQEPIYYTPLPRGSGFVAYLALFILSGAYGHVITGLEVQPLDWLKLFGSTVIAVLILVAVELQLHFRDLLPARLLLAVTLVAFGVKAGVDAIFMTGLTELLSNWLVWNF